jgi:hypothetical protein
MRFLALSLAEKLKTEQGRKKSMKKNIVSRGNTRIFHITTKLRMEDPVSVVIDSKKVVKRVERWIEDDPASLWNVIHSKGGKIELVRDVYAALKEKIRKDYPDLYADNEVKKQAHMLDRSRKKLMEKVLKGKAVRLPRLRDSGSDDSSSS